MRCVTPHRTAPHRTTVQAEKLRQQLRAMEHRAGAMRADKEIFASENERLQLEYSLVPQCPECPSAGAVPEYSLVPQCPECPIG